MVRGDRERKFQKRPEILVDRFARESTNIFQKLEQMGLDLLLFQGDKDGDPELIKQSQRARFKSEEIVDEIQDDYKQWTRG